MAKRLDLGAAGSLANLQRDEEKSNNMQLYGTDAWPFEEISKELPQFCPAP
jgi:hypothetical protein